VDQKGLSILLISHDMAVIGTMCERINVMYAGTVVESAPKQVLITEPAHPYTKALLNAIPEMVWGKKQRLRAIDGTVPSLIHPPEGCRFAPRCSYVLQKCMNDTPTLVQVGTDHHVKCHLFERGPS
jgi:oligopeptide/dipeptide ABC transporter ATP-binding protein